jgi:hypothetical protein
MSIQTIAHDLVNLCKQGKFAEAGEKYWDDNVISVEAMGDNAEVKGKAAARGKGEWWEKNHTVHSALVEGPYINGNQFVVRFKMDMTMKQNNERRTMDEVGLYTIRKDKIIEERFFYGE